MLLLFAIAGGILFLTLSNSKKAQRDPALTAIEDFSMHGKEIDKKVFNPICEKYAEKEKNKQKLTVEEAFVLGYDEYYKYEDEDASRHLKYAIENFTEDTDSFTKISACLFWNQLYADSDNWDEKVGYLKKVLDSCTIDEWNNHYGSIGTLLYTVTNDANGKKTCIDLLTKILEQEKQLDDSVVLAIRNDLAVIYGANSSYAKAIEQSLYTISKAEEMGNNYFQAKAKTDMSTIYDTLGDYDTARKLAEESLAFDLTGIDKEKLAYIRSYTLSSLCQIIYHSQQYEEIDTIQKEIEQYYKDLTEYEVAGYKIAIMLSQIEADIKENKLDKVPDQFAEIDKMLEDAKNSSALNLTLYYDITKADYYQAINKYDKALTIYENTLSVNETDSSYKNRILEQVIQLANEMDKPKTEIFYYKKMMELYKAESIAINKDYADYSIQKYNTEQKIKRVNQKEMRRTIFMMGLIVLIFVIVIIFLTIVRSMNYISKIDGLTKTYNRGFFQKQYPRYLEKSKSGHVIMFDIDNFKSVNDTYGHLTGDTVLSTVAATVKHVAAKQSKIYRYGGEEFVLLTKDMSTEQSVALAEKIRQSVEKLTWKEEGMHITISMGIGHLQTDEGDLIEFADKRLYIAKKNGKNQVVSE